MPGPYSTPASTGDLATADGGGGPGPGAEAGDFFFGGHPGRGDREANLLNLEAQIGRQFDLVRVFERWDSPFPEPYHDEIVNGDRLMLLSVRALEEDGTVITWRSIADAAPGSATYNQVVAWAQRVKNIGLPVWFSFNHEPEFAGNTANGTDQDFVDAWRRVHEIFAAENADNVAFVWIMTDYSFVVPATDRRQAIKWYPGDDVVDHIAADAYNWSDCRPGQFNPWRSLQEIIDPLRQFGIAHPDKGLLLAEWASTESGGNKADWITEAADLFQTPGWEQFVAVAYWNDIDPASPACNFPVDSSPAAMSSFTSMGALPFYSQQDPG